MLPSKQACYVAYDGQEILKDSYDVLCYGNISWVQSHPSTRSVPPFAVAGGTTADGEPLYIGKKSTYFLNLNGYSTSNFYI